MAHIDFYPGTWTRVDALNYSLLEMAVPHLNAQVERVTARHLRLCVDDPRTAIEWLITAEIVDPAEDIYIVCD